MFSCEIIAVSKIMEPKRLQLRNMFDGILYVLYT